MNTLGIAIMLCIGNTTGWLATMYVKDGERRLLRNVSVGILGALGAGSLIAYVLPQSGTGGEMIAGMVGAVLLLLLDHSGKLTASGRGNQRPVQ